MPKGFRPSLEPPSHRKIEREVRRPCFCVAVSVTAGLLVFLIFAVSGWNVYDHRYSKRTYHFHSGDEVSVAIVASDFSDTFCDGYTVSTWERATAYLLPSHAWVNTSSTVRVPIHIKEIPTVRNDVQAFYLLKDSNLDLSICRENGSTSHPSEAVVIKGDSGFREYHKHHHCSNCVVARVDIPLDAMCDEHNETAGPVTLTATVNESDSYFLFVSYGRSPPTHHHLPGIEVNGTLTRTLYDLKDAERKCKMDEETDCHFQIPWNSDKDVVVRFRQIPGPGEIGTTLITRCKLRVVVWVFVFGVPPLVLFVLASIMFACVFCKKRKRSLTQHQRKKSVHGGRGEVKVGDRNDLVENEVVPQDEDHTITIQDE